MRNSSLKRSADITVLLTRDHTVLPATHTFIHKRLHMCAEQFNAVLLHFAGFDIFADN